MITLLTTAALTGPVLDPGRGVPPPGAEGVTTIVQWVAWLVLSLCVLGVLMVGGRMAVAHRRGEGVEYAAGLGFVLGGAVLVGSASGLIAALVS